MKCLSIQLQEDIDSAHTVDELVEHVRSFGRYPEIDRGENDEKYVNLNFFTEDLRAMWPEFKSKVLNDTSLGEWVKKVAIIACEGDQGWDNHILLWHYDPSEVVGKL